MIIDDVIRLIEKDERRWRKLGYKDPYGARPSFLVNLMGLDFRDVSWKADQIYRTKIWFLENKINHLIDIVRRLRKALTFPIQEQSLETKNKQYIEIDIESFFHFSYSILEIMARLTPRFYKPPLKGLKSKSFRKQREWFMNNPEKDPKYSKYLVERNSWFEKLREHRRKLTHYHPLITFQSSEHGITFGTGRDKEGYIPNVGVSEYINKTASELLDFIFFYDKHFGQKLLPERQQIQKENRAR